MIVKSFNVEQEYSYRNEQKPYIGSVTLYDAAGAEVTFKLSQAQAQSLVEAVLETLSAVVAGVRTDLRGPVKAHEPALLTSPLED